MNIKNNLDDNMMCVLKQNKTKTFSFFIWMGIE